MMRETAVAWFGRGALEDLCGYLEMQCHEVVRNLRGRERRLLLGRRIAAIPALPARWDVQKMVSQAKLRRVRLSAIENPGNVLLAALLLAALLLLRHGGGGFPRGVPGPEPPPPARSKRSRLAPLRRVPGGNLPAPSHWDVGRTCKGWWGRPARR